MVSLLCAGTSQLSEGVVCLGAETILSEARSQASISIGVGSSVSLPGKSREREREKYRKIDR